MDPNDSLWVDRQLESLDHAPGWEPNTADALARFQRLHRQAAVARKRRIWFAFAAAAACLAVVSILPRSSAPPARTPRLIVPASFRMAGSPTAPIVAEIYSDYECGHCAALMLETLPQLVHDFVDTGKVRLLHRDLPLPQHRHAREAARYANAAGRIGRYDLAVQGIFRSQQQWSQDGNIDARLAQVLTPAEMAQVRETVRNSSDLDATIDADMDMARADEVRETPAMVVVANGKRHTLSPVPPYDQLKGYLDAALRMNCREDPKASRC
jgi:protein-disulfide isomerase